VATGLLRAIVAGISATGMIAGFAWMSPRSSSGVIFATILALVAAGLITPRLRGFVRESRRRRGRLANNLGERIMAITTIRELGRGRAERRKIRRQSAQMADALVRRMGLAAALRSLPELAMPLAVAFVALAAVRHPQASGEAVVAVLLIGMISTSLRDLARSWDHRLAFDEGRRRIEQVPDGPRLRNARNARSLPEGGPVSLDLDGVGVEGIFEGLSLHVDPGERIRIVGASGAGKSTLCVLAARCFDPAAGEIRVDGIPLRRLRLRSVRSTIQRVTPDLPLLRGTVRENLGYGAPDATADWIEQVATACALTTASDLFLDGLDTPLAEGGGDLPAGARARVALARACATRLRLLLVDDPIFSTDRAAAGELAAVSEISSFTRLMVDTEHGAQRSGERVVRLHDGVATELVAWREAEPSAAASSDREVGGADFPPTDPAR